VKQASRYETVNAVLGLALIGFLFAPWSRIPCGWTCYAPGDSSRGGILNLVSTFTGPGEVSAWDAHTVLAAVLAVYGLALVTQRFILATTTSPAAGLAWNVSLVWTGMALSIWTLVVVLDGAERWGAIAALATVMGAVLVGWLGIADERIDRARAAGVPESPIPAP
jgi:hypothetical protein